MTARQILVVEDELNVRRTLAQMLCLSGFEVAEAEDGPHAVSLAQSAVFDLVLSDIRLPGMDGYATLQQIRRIHPVIRGIAMTGYADASSYDLAHQAGFREILRKPFTFDTLLKAVEAAFTDAPA